MVKSTTVILLSVAGAVLSGCATRVPVDVEKLPPPAAGDGSEHVVDNSDVAFYTTGEWGSSQSSPGYQGQDYSFSAPGSGNSVATWNLNIIKTFDVFAKWTTHPNRGSNVKFVVHHLDDRGNLITDTVTVDQRERGGQWVKLGTYRMSALTGRVTVSDDADGYVIADAVLFREVGVGAPSETADSDGDGLTDSWETSYGLDPNDPSDASLDPDGDGLTNQDEFLLQTDPTAADTDSDGIPDGFEASYGLNPAVDDAGDDPDGDGVSSYDEYLANTDPNDEASTPSGSSVLLTWEAPTQRTDGSPLPPDEIAEYELVYQKVVQSQSIVVDNESTDFIVYGSGGTESTSTNGYRGSNYYVLPAGTGEISAEWTITNLTSGRGYELQANWTSHPNRASNAQFTYTFVDDSGQQVSESTTVDQRNNGGSWQSLGTFTAGDSSINIRVTNDANGYVIADAVRVDVAPPPEESIIIEATGENRYVLTGLSEGDWEFKIRAIDSSGVAGDFSEVKSQVVE